MAFTKLEPTGVNTSATFTFAEANITGNLTVNGVSNLGPASNVIITGGTNGQVLTTDGSGGLTWATGSGGGGSYANANVAAYLPTYTGNISANYFIGNGSSLTNIAGANVTGTVANATYATSAGSATTAGTVTTNAQPNITSVGVLTGLTTTDDIISGGTLVSNFSAGNEGGEIRLALPQTGTTLNSSVTIDMHQNRLRIFESGGTNRGGYFDITALAAGVGTDLLAGGSGGYANSNVAAYLPTYTGNFTAGNINVTGNVTSAYFIGNGSSLSALNASNITTGTIPSGVLGNSTVYVGTTSIALNRSSGSQSLTGVNIDGSASTVTTATQPNITSVGTLVDANVSGNLFVGGNLTVNGTTEYTNVNNLYVKDPIIEMGGNANAGPLTTNDGKDRGTVLHYYTTSPVDAFMGWDNSNGEFAFGSNVSVSSEVVTFNTFGNIRASTFLGSLSGSATTAATVTTNAQPNITSVGTLTGLTVSNSSGVVNLMTTANVSLGDVGNLHITGGTSGQYLQTDGSGTLSWATVSSGSTSNISNGTSNVNIATSGGNVTTSVGGNANIVVVTGTGANVNGYLNVTGALSTGGGTGGSLLGANVISANYFIGDGSQLTGLPSSYSNANVALYLPTFTGNISANYFIGNGSSLTNITGGNVAGQVSNALIAGTVTTNAQPNITSVGTLSSLTVSGLVTATAGGIKVGNIQDTTGTNTISVSSTTTGIIGNLNVGTGGTGNVTATYFIGNGSQLTGISAGSTYSNANVASYLPTYTGNFTAGNGTISGSFAVNGSFSAGSGTGGSISGANVITANYFVGDGSSLTSVTASTATTAVTVTANAQPNITSLGTLTSLSVTGTSVFGLSSDETTYVSASTSGTVTCDTSTTGPVWYYTTIAGATTLNFTNLPTTDGYTTVVSAIFSGTAVVPAVQIAGSAQTIKWVTGTAPTGNAGGINIYTFACVRVNSAWTAILGSYTYYA